MEVWHVKTRWNLSHDLSVTSDPFCLALCDPEPTERLPACLLQEVTLTRRTKSLCSLTRRDFIPLLVTSEWRNLEVKHKIFVPITTKIPFFFLQRLQQDLFSVMAAASTSGKINRVWALHGRVKKLEKYVLGARMDNPNHPVAAKGDCWIWTGPSLCPSLSSDESLSLFLAGLLQKRHLKNLRQLSHHSPTLQLLVRILLCCLCRRCGALLCSWTSRTGAWRERLQHGWRDSLVIGSGWGHSLVGNGDLKKGASSDEFH